VTRHALFAAALLVGGSFSWAAWSGWDGAAVVAWKGAGVALLALWAFWEATRRGDRQIALVLALGALGDVLLDTAGLIVGAVAFLIGHLVAIDLYRRHPAGPPAPALLAAVLVSAVGGALTWDPGVAIYAFGLGGMAGMATISRFPPRVAIGAWLFVASDLLIFARFGPLAGSAVPRLLVWPLYFAGQALIAHGVVTRLRRHDNIYHRL
jgi:uncharacterized membrane protein YhhN